MKKMEMRHGETVLSDQTYLHRLGKYLLFYFPVKQVSEILADYQEYFLTAEEKRDTAGHTPQWGTPKEVLKALLEENPLSKIYFYKWSLFWGILLLLSVACLFYSGRPAFIAMILAPFSLLGLTHGWSQMKIERDFPEAEDKMKARVPLVVHCLIPVVVLFLETEIQFFIKNAGNMPLYIRNLPVGLVIDMEYAFFQLLFFLLMIWTGKRMVTTSVQYMAGATHALGAILFIMDIRRGLHSMNISGSETGMLFMFPLVYYGIGLGLSILFRLALAYAWNK